MLFPSKLMLGVGVNPQGGICSLPLKKMRISFRVRSGSSVSTIGEAVMDRTKEIELNKYLHNHLVSG